MIDIHRTKIMAGTRRKRARLLESDYRTKASTFMHRLLTNRLLCLKFLTLGTFGHLQTSNTSQAMINFHTLHSKTTQANKIEGQEMFKNLSKTSRSILNQSSREARFLRCQDLGTLLKLRALKRYPCRMKNFTR